MAKPSISNIAIASNMVQGVSQQAPQNRRAAQCEEQFDCTNSVLDGVIPRPHAEFVKQLGSGLNLANGFFSETSHGPDENYVIAFDASGYPRVFNLEDGTMCSVTYTSGVPYLQTQPGGTTSKDTIRSQVVDDYTFALNRNVIPAMAGTTSPAKVNEALIFVRSTGFKQAYKIRLTGPGSASIDLHTSNTVGVPTQDVAEAIRSGTTTADIDIDSGAGLDGQGGYTVIRTGSVLRVRHSSGDPFTLYCEDGGGDDYLLGMNGTIRSASKIPARCFDGTILKVKGEDHTSDDDYFLKFVGAPTTGYWEETVGPGTQTTINPATMPVGILCTGLNTFEVKQLAWSTRIAGDADTAKSPSFIGKKPRALMYHQSRLGVLWEGGAVFSKTRNPYTFFPDTVQTKLATAPIDTTLGGSSGKGPPVLDFALEFQENLFVWAQQQQFRIDSGQDPFKEDTVEIRNSMAYEYSPLAYPLGIGAFLFLSTDVGDSASLRTLFFSSGKLSGDTDVTAHAPKYIPAGISVLTGSDTLRQLYIVSDDDRSVLTQFCWTYSSNEGFIQTALNKWRIPGGQVLWASLKGNILRVIQQRPEGAFLLHFNLSPQVVDPVVGAKYMTRLDFRVDETEVTGLAYASGVTTFQLPYTPTGMDVLVATREDLLDGYTRGRQFKVLSVVGSTVAVEGDLTPYKFYVGQRIRSERLDSEFFIRTENGAEPVDSITLNRFKLEMANAQYTRVEVTLGDELWTEVFEGRVLGTDTGRTGAPDPQSADLDIGIGRHSSEVKVRLINDTFMNSAWQNSSYDFDAVGWKGAK